MESKETHMAGVLMLNTAYKQIINNYPNNYMASFGNPHISA